MALTQSDLSRRAHIFIDNARSRGVELRLASRNKLAYKGSDRSVRETKKDLMFFCLDESTVARELWRQAADGGHA